MVSKHCGSKWVYFRKACLSKSKVFKGYGSSINATKDRKKSHGSFTSYAQGLAPP